MAFIKFPRRNNESRKDKTALRRQRTQKTFGARYMGIGAEGHQKQESEIKKIVHTYPHRTLWSGQAFSPYSSPTV